MTCNPQNQSNASGLSPVALRDVAAYFDTHQAIYTHFWSATALHYGFWYEHTKTLDEAIKNTDRFIINSLSITADDVVLDAGCGVGGSSVYIAEQTGARVHGITLSDVQLRIANRRAEQSLATSRMLFSVQDYTRTNFPDEAFTKIFGIESICYAAEKADFLTEAYRILQPGGRIAVVDAFLTNDELTPAERKVYRKFAHGWVVPNLPTAEGFRSQLSEAGFTNIKYYDMQRYVTGSIRRIYLWSLITSPINIILSKLGLVRENLAAYYQRQLFIQGIAKYGVYTAEKSKENICRSNSRR